MSEKLEPGSLYEDMKPVVKERDNWTCVHGCEVKGPVDSEGHPKLLFVVRKDRWEPDSVPNLQTVCRKHVPEWEK